VQRRDTHLHDKLTCMAHDALLACTYQVSTAGVSLNGLSEGKEKLPATASLVLRTVASAVQVRLRGIQAFV